MSAGDTHPAWAASTVRERQSPRASSTGCCTAKKAGPQSFASSPARRVVVKARILRHQGRSFRSAPLTAHLSYLKREGVTRNSEKAVMFDVGSDCTDDAAFADRCKDDRHHFCFIVSPEDAGEMTDFKVFTRDLARQMKVDLGTRLDLGRRRSLGHRRPHVHLLVRGVDQTGADLVIARDYISRGLRSRAEEFASIKLGPKPEHEIRNALEKEIAAERWTRLDVQIRLAADEPAPSTCAPQIPGGTAASLSVRIRLVLNRIGRWLTEDLHARDRRHRILMTLDEFPALGRLDFSNSRWVSWRVTA